MIMGMNGRTWEHGVEEKSKKGVIVVKLASASTAVVLVIIFSERERM